MAAPYLPGGLTQDELDRALAMSQGRQPMPEQSLPPPQQAPIEAAPPPMAQPQEEEPVEAVEPEPAIALPTGRPKENIGQLKSEVVDLQNERAAGIAGLGDKSGLREDDYTKLAETHQRSGEQNKATADAAKVDLEESRKREAVQRERAEQIWKEMEASKQAPPDSTVTKVLGILGSVLAMGSNKGGTAQGVQMLMGMLGSDKDRWAQERAANSDLYKKALEAADNERSTQLEHLEGSQKVAALEAHEIADVLKSVESMGLGKTATAVAQDMTNAFVTEAKQGILKGEEMKQKELEAKAAAATKLKRAAAEAGQRDSLAHMDEGMLQQLLANNELSEMGQQILAEKIKRRQTGTKGEAESLEAQNKALAGPESKMGADERKVQRLLSGVAPAVANIRKMAAAGEAPSHPYADNAPDIFRSKEALNKEADINSVADILLRDESGAAIGADEQAKKLRGWGLTSGDPDVRRRGIQKMLAEYDARLTGKPAVIDEDAAPKQYKTFKRDAAPSGSKSAQQLAQEYLDSRGGAGAGGT